MKSRFYFLLLLLNTHICGYSQSYWDGFSVPMVSAPYFTQNGQCYDLAVTSNGTYLMSSVGAGIQKSTDSGITWTPVNTNGELGIRNIEIDASGNIWATTSGGTNRLLKSTDGGNNFAAVTATFATTQYFTILRALPNGRIILGLPNGTTGQQLQISTDASVTTFTAITTAFGFINDVETDANNAIYVSGNSTSGWIVKSTNFGATFSTIPLAASTTNVSDIAISGTKMAVASTSGVYLSQDLGSTWTSIRGNLTQTAFIGHIRFDASGNLFFMNLSFSTTHFTQNSGATWTTLSNIRPSMQLSAFNFEVAFKTATEWTLVSFPGVLKTFDGGKSWQGGPLSNTTTFSDVLVSSVGHTYIAASGVNGFAVQESFNPTATPLAVPQWNSNRPITGFIESNAAIYAYGASGILRAANTGAVLGSQFTLQTTQPFSNLVSIGSTLYSVSGTNLLASTNLGVTWTTTPISGFSGSATKVVASRTANFIYVQSGTSLFKIDAATAAATGLTGSAPLLPATVLDIAVGGTALWVLTSTTSLRRSIDEGVSFVNRILPGTFSANRVWGYSDQIVFTRSSTTNVFAINTSLNGGGFWSQQSLLNSGAGVSVANLTVSPTGNIVAVVNNGGNTSLHKSKKSATPPLAPANLRVMTSSPATPTFTYPQSGSIEFIMDDNSNNEDYFVVERSTDNINWDSVTYELPENFTQKRAFNGNQPDMVQGTLYYYRIQAVNSVGRSAFTNVVSATLTPYCVSTIPDNRSWTAVVTPDAGYTATTANVTASNVNISKNAGSNDRFFIENYSFSIVPTPTIGARNPAAVSGTNIQENCGVVNFITTTNSDMTNGMGTWNSSTGTLTIKWQTLPRFNTKWHATTVFTLNATDPAPDVPVLNGYVYSSTEVFLAWNQVTFASKYLIERSTDFGTTYTPLVTVNYPATSYIDKNLPQGSTPYYKIRAKHDFGAGLNPPGQNPSESAWSTEIAVQLGNTVFRPIESDLSLNLDNQQGSSWGDFDGDGDEDIVLCTFSNIAGQSVPPSFFENIGNAQFTRKAVEVVANDFDAITRAAGVMDFNNDGKLDIYFDRNGPANDFVLINSGNWQFTKLLINENTPGASIENLAMADYDKDGYVDFYVGTADTGTTPPSLPNYLIKNTGGTSTTQITTGSVPW